MKLEDQVCTISQGQHLQKLGLTATGRFMWRETGNVDPYAPQECIDRYDKESYENIGICFAYTVAELGVMIAGAINSDNMKTNDYPRCDHRNEYKWYLPNKFKVYQHFDTEAQARAAMLIYLQENKLITPSSVNERI